MKKFLFSSLIVVALCVTACDRANHGGSGSGTDVNKGQGSSSDVSVSSGTQSSGSSASDKQPDNTGVNKRDRDDKGLTSGDQANNETDREITRKIRRAITSNDQLSITAKNIKIITADGKTTLRGPVKSDQEKQQIVAAAKSVQGVGQVDDQLEVKSQTEKAE